MPRKLSKIRSPYNFVHGHPRMSWAPDNLFNLYNRCFGPESRNTTFKQSSKTLFQQRWASKTMARGYHGDWLQEKRLKHHFLPSFLPHPNAASIAKRPERKFATGRYASRQPESDEPIPLTNLMWTDLERRLDVLVFRANFAPSVYAARHLVIHGKVRVNGIRERNPNVKLDPGALFSVEPTAISMLHIPADVEQAKRRRLTLDEKKAFARASAAADGASAEEQGDQAARASEGEAAPSAEAPSAEAPSEEAPNSGPASGGESEQPEASTSALPEAPVSERPNQARLAHLGGAEKVKEGEEVKIVATADQRRRTAAAEGPLAFVLPDYAAPHIFIPAYLEVSYETCSAVFVRLPTARPGLSEIPSPYEADGEIAKFTLEWYAQHNKRLYKTPRTPGPYRVEFERTGLHGHGGALVAEHLAKLRKPGETLTDRAQRLQQRQREVMAQARRHALSKLPPHVHAMPHPSERAS